MGRIVAPYGVKGWVKVAPQTALPDTLLAHEDWWVREGGSWQARKLVLGRPHGGALVAQLAGIADREAAAKLAGLDVGIARSALPVAGEGEIYWADLVGLAVFNRQGEALGTVAQVQDFGAHPILRVEQAGQPARLIPFVPAYIDGVDVGARRIEVDWRKDF